MGVGGIYVAVGVHNDGTAVVFWDGHGKYFAEVLNNDDACFSVSAD